MELTSENLGKVFMDCLFTDKEEAEKVEPIKVRGIVVNVGFHPDRLESHRGDVSDMLACLPDNFHKDKGGGWSFLNACMDKNEVQWGGHREMEQLFMLGIGLELVQWQLPREMWVTLPGGMPYVVIL